MDNWGMQRSERSHRWKPRPGNWQLIAPTVPFWEKKFCWEVGAVPWRKLLETKEFIDIYGNILGWKDSAAKEAFDNAKARYWAELNGLKCDIPKPDPNSHIDEVDWNDETNPELILDLDCYDEVTDDTNRESVVIFPEGFGQEVTDDGWGEGGVDFRIPTDAELEKLQEDCLRVYAEMAINEDWNDETNPELIPDLDRDDDETDDMNREGVVICPEGFGHAELENSHEDCLRVYADMAINEESEVQETRDDRVNNNPWPEKNLKNPTRENFNQD